MPRVEVNSDEIYQLSQRMGELAVTLNDLGISLGTLNSKAENFIANWLTASGRTATGIILGSRSENEALTQDIGTLCVKLASAADGYLGVEEKAAEMLKQYERGLPSGWEVQGAPSIGRNYINDWSADGVSSWKDAALTSAKQSGNLVSYLVGKALFGAERYMDVRANRGNPYGMAKQSLITAGLLKIYDKAGEGISSVIQKGSPEANALLKRHGVVRNLDHAEVITDQKALAGIEDLRVPQNPADFAHNEWVLSHLDEQVDSYMAEQGRVVQYQGVVVQLIENEDGVQTAIVYVSGTDSGSVTDELSGNPATWTADVGEVAVDPDNPLSQGTASMQLIEEALKHAGIPAGTNLILAGFSKGGATAYNFAHNKEMQAKYEMKGIYDQAGPTGRLKSSGKDIPHIKVTNHGDMVSYLGGSYSDEQAENMHVINVDSEAMGSTRGPHGYDVYNETAMADPEMNTTISEFESLTGGAHQVGDARLVAGSTLPQDTTQNGLKAYQASVAASVAYDAADLAEEIVPQEINAFGVKIDTPIPNVIDLPAVVSDENTADEYFEAGYKLFTGKNFDATPPSLDWSAEHFTENEKAFEFTVGTQDKPHLDIQIDSGKYDIDFSWGEEKGSPFELLESAKESLEKQFPENPEGWNEKPSSSQWEKPGYSKPVTAPQGGIEFTPASPEYAGAGGNF